MTVSVTSYHCASAGDDAVVDLQHVHDANQGENVDKETEKDGSQKPARVGRKASAMKLDFAECRLADLRNITGVPSETRGHYRAISQ